MGQSSKGPQAELVGTGKKQRILIRIDNNSEFSRKVRPEDKAKYPELFKTKKQIAAEVKAAEEAELAELEAELEAEIEAEEEVE